MRKFIELWQWVIAHYRDPDHDQRKQFATACNTVAAIVIDFFPNQENRIMIHDITLILSGNGIRRTQNAAT